MPLLDRRAALASGLAAALLPTTGLARTAIGEAGELRKRVLPPPIGVAEREARLERARGLMRVTGIGAVIVEPGASLDYLTGVQWWRSERLTAAIVPVEGDPVIVTPFFERPSVAESLAVKAEIRTWNEDEEPLKLVADVLRERQVAGAPVGFEETNRYFILERLRQQLPALRFTTANPVVRRLRMVKTASELALMQAANDITLAAIRHAGRRVKAGMSPGDIDAMITAATVAMGGRTDGGLVLLGEAAAYPHGSHKPQSVRRGEVVLMDCGCSVHGYESDISRTFVFGADPTPQQKKVWTQVRRGQEIAMAAAKLGAPAGSVDDAVRAAYTSWGYGPGYQLPGLSHRTGHGIGMEGHEPVNLVHGEPTALATGMCFSNEPGIYLPGSFGVRLEDCFHMTESGPQWFTVPPASPEAVLA
ncbi:aminopeptidase P family protein [Sphingomonas ginkgonis]|uniref:Aminopeptidase P family protein n=1 Tax=Sphingomonas ginkgonis TaxID=2315330 RepID=A0A429VAV0_9SPHN|nr:Xaa-Pro peptidase family protein [Sphingomonas ginkgonis]RST30972.1 aminopeptidase P family protein [Sphingomonas ginkgonis]